MPHNFERLLLDHPDVQYTLARRFGDNDLDAEDRGQETSLSAWKAWKQDGPPDDSRA